MPHIVTFDTDPTPNPDAIVGHSRHVVNVSTGIGMDVLRRIIEEHIPIVNHERVGTKKRVIRTSRYECPCCHTGLMALIEVECDGLMTGTEQERRRVEGLYEIEIVPDHSGTKVTVRKFSGTEIFVGRAPYLPQKDYASNPEALQEMQERYNALKAFAQERPGSVLRVDGVETGDERDPITVRTL